MSDHFKNAASATHKKPAPCLEVSGACWGGSGSAVQVLR